MANSTLCTRAECSRRFVDLVHHAERLGARKRRAPRRRRTRSSRPSSSGRRGVGDHRGVHPDAAHHHEGPLLDVAPSARLMRRQADVDRMTCRRNVAAHHRRPGRRAAAAGCAPAGCRCRSARSTRGTPLSLIASATARTVPSPPATITASTPLLERLPGHVVAQIVDVVSKKRGVAHPAAFDAFSTSRAERLAFDLDGVVDEGGPGSCPCPHCGVGASCGDTCHGYTLGRRVGMPRPPLTRLE